MSWPAAVLFSLALHMVVIWPALSARSAPAVGDATGDQHIMAAYLAPASGRPVPAESAPGKARIAGPGEAGTRTAVADQPPTAIVAPAPAKAEPAPPQVSAAVLPAITPSVTAIAVDAHDSSPAGEHHARAAEVPEISQPDRIAFSADVLDWLRKHQRYPRSARRAGVEGVVQVRFMLDRRGRLIASSLTGSSGSAVLDRAALDLLRRAAPFPGWSARSDVGKVELELPIAYRLGDQGA